jgi:hypothetical protein
VTARPYADQAERYWRAGWPNPIPVRDKDHPPTGFTGYDGANVSWPDLQAWLDGPQAGHNIALRLPSDVVGVDVDAYDGKVGEISLAAAEAELGPLPATWRSTSRAPFTASGIRFYRCSAAVDLRGAEKRFVARFGDHVDILRRDHRYAIVWPSVHPHTGATYFWYDPTVDRCDLPSPADLPDLPEAWQTFLTAPTSAPVTAASVGGSSPWDGMREFTRDEAVEFVRPAFERLRTAVDGTINNRLNEAAVMIGHFVPAFWPWAQAEAWLLEALTSTVYDGRTWRAENTIASGLGAKTWRAVLREGSVPAVAVAPAERPVRRGEFTGVRNRKRAEPQFIRRADGHGLLYPGKDSYLYAETESGKSWLAALGVVQCVTNNVPVLVVDFEEGDELEYGNRLLDLGLDEAQLNDPAKFRYLMVDGRCAAEVLAEAEEMGARVVIYEGMSVAYDVYGLQVKENDSATAFRRTLVKPHLVAGRAVLTTDHVVKDRDNRGRYAIGAVMKLNAASGGAFLLTNVEGLAPGRRGASNLYVTKDRPGGVKRYGVSAGDKFDPQVRRFGTLVVDDSRSFVSYLDVKILAPAPEEMDEPPITPLGDKIIVTVGELLSAGRVPNLRAIRGEGLGRYAEVADEIERLLTRRRLIETIGARGSRVFDLPPVDMEEEA